MSFSSRLQHAIAQSGKSQKQVGDEVGVSPAGLYNYLRGKRVPDLDVAVRLARACSVTVAYLCGEQEELGAPTSTNVPNADVARVPATLQNDLLEVMKVTQRSPEDLGRKIGASVEDVEQWLQGKAAPSLNQLASILNLIVPFAFAARASNNPQNGGREGRSLRRTGT